MSKSRKINKEEKQKLEDLVVHVEKTIHDLKVRGPVISSIVPALFCTVSALMINEVFFEANWMFFLLAYLFTLLLYWPIAFYGLKYAKFCALAYLYGNILLIFIFLSFTIALWINVYDFKIVLVHIVFCVAGTIMFIYQRVLEFDLADVKKESFAEEIFAKETGELKKFTETASWQKRKADKTLYAFEDTFMYYLKKFFIFPIIIVGPALMGITMGMGKIGLQYEREVFTSYCMLFLYYLFLYVAFPKYAAYLVYSREEKRIGKQIYFTDIEVLKAELEKLNQ